MLTLTKEEAKEVVVAFMEVMEQVTDAEDLSIITGLDIIECEKHCDLFARHSEEYYKNRLVKIQNE